MKTLFNHLLIPLSFPVVVGGGYVDDLSKVANPTGPGCEVLMSVPAHLSPCFSQSKYCLLQMGTRD